MDNTVRSYGKQPYTIGLLHGGPGAAGEMKPVAETYERRNTKRIKGKKRRHCSFH